MNTVLILGLFFLLVILKVPIAFSLLLSSIISCYILNLAPLTAIASAAMNSLFSYPLLAIHSIFCRIGYDKRRYLQETV